LVACSTGESPGFAPFQDLIHENGSATKDLTNIHPVAFGNNSPL
jgi:hypothetical protein